MLRSLLAGLFSRSGSRRSDSSAARAAAASAPLALSVIICSVDDARFARVSASLEERLAGVEFELIRIRDARSLAEGYNRGLEQSHAPLLIFCHDDIELLQPDFAQRLMAHMASFDVLGVAGTSRLSSGRWGDAGVPDTHGQVLQPLEGRGYVLNVFCQHGHGHGQAAGHGVQAVDGLFIATRREVAGALRFDAQTYDGFHLYDLDFSFRAHLAGYRVGVCHDILIYHESTGRRDAECERYTRIFEDRFAGQLSRAPAGPPLVYQVRVADKAQGLQAFERVMKNEMAFRQPAEGPREAC